MESGKKYKIEGKKNNDKLSCYMHYSTFSALILKCGIPFVFLK
jgi:hypothetical protein